VAACVHWTWWQPDTCELQGASSTTEKWYDWPTSGPATCEPPLDACKKPANADLDFCKNTNDIQKKTFFRSFVAVDNLEDSSDQRRINVDGQTVIIPSELLEATPIPYRQKHSHYQQFSKWVTYNSAYADKMHKSVINNVVRTRFDLNNFPEDNFIGFESLEQNHGPYTQVFHNPPPGIYQVVAAHYSNVLAIREWAALDVQVGDAHFVCRVNPDCQFDSTIWNIMNFKIDDEGTKLDIPESPEAAIDFQPGSVVVVFANLFFVADGMTLERGMRGVVTSTTRNQLHVTFEAPIAPKVATWAPQGTTRQEIVSKFAAEKHLRILSATNEKVFSINLLDQRATMQPLRELDRPARPRWHNDFNWFTTMFQNQYATPPTDNQWQDVCYGECEPEPDKAEYSGCLERNSAVRRTWINRFDWYPFVKYHVALVGLHKCDVGHMPRQDACLEAGRYVAQKVAPSKNVLQELIVVNEREGHPAGCSILDINAVLVTFNTNAQGMNDGSHQLICTGSGITTGLSA